jgi:hypothetical protein
VLSYSLGFMHYFWIKYEFGTWGRTLQQDTAYNQLEVLLSAGGFWAADAA